MEIYLGGGSHVVLRVSWGLGQSTGLNGRVSGARGSRETIKFFFVFEINISVKPLVVPVPLITPDGASEFSQSQHRIRTQATMATCVQLSNALATEPFWLTHLELFGTSTVTRVCIKWPRFLLSFKSSRWRHLFFLISPMSCGSVHEGIGYPEPSLQGCILTYTTSKARAQVSSVSTCRSTTW